VLGVGRSASIAAVRSAIDADDLVWIVAQRDGELDDPTPEHLYEVGCIAKIESAEWLPDYADVRVHGLVRARVQGHRGPRVHVEAIDEAAAETCSVDARTHAVLTELARAMVRQRGAIDRKHVDALVGAAPGPGRLADLVVATLGVALPQQQQFLELLDIPERTALVLDANRLEPADAKAVEMFAVRQQIVRQLRQR
jgi:ATP-dependent Lon protease